MNRMTQSYSLDEIIDKEKKFIMPTYTRPHVVLTEGKGAILRDLTGNEYIDCVGGIAVNAVGYSHPMVVQAIKEQVDKLMHVSNLYYTVPQVELAEKLVQLTGMSKVFFCNSGAESVEAALKLATRTTGKGGFIAAEGSFHGRTIGALSLTSGHKFRSAFTPLLLKNVKFVRYGDADAIDDAIGDDTAAVVLEPIQGENGVVIPPDGYLKAVRDICTDKKVLLILDEIQTGFGRTGRWFGKDHESVEPDIMTLAKALGAGFPIGAILAREGLEFKAGEHASTFGGNPLACSAALASIRVIESEELVTHSRELGTHLMTLLQDLDGTVVKEIRGRGLMIGIELNKPCADIAAKALERRVLVNCTAERVIRLVPPLVISQKELTTVASVLHDVITA